MEYLKMLTPEDMVKLKTTWREPPGADNLPAQKAKSTQSVSNSEEARSSEVPNTNAFGGSHHQLTASHSQELVDVRSTRDNDIATASATTTLMEYLKMLTPEDMVKLKTTWRETPGADNLPAQKTKSTQSESNSEEARSSEVPNTNAFGGSHHQLTASHSQDLLDSRSTRDNDESALGTQDPEGHKIADWERQLLDLNEGKRQRVEREKQRKEDWERQLLENKNERRKVRRKELRAQTDREQTANRRSSEEEFNKKLDLDQTQKVR
jgi:hypothetical protein